MGSTPSASSDVSPAPLTVTVSRGDMVESRHRVHAVVVDATGGVRHAWGRLAMEIYPRSAIKPLQALPLVETGAADAFQVTDEELALAAGSHAGTAAHLMVLGAWFERAGIDEDALELGAHRPFDHEAADRLVKAGRLPAKRHNNCSGKHLGFLTTAKHLGESLEGYLAPDHPVQRRCLEVLESLGGTPLGGTARGGDGCGVPVYGMPLAALARAMAAFANPEGAGVEARRAAALNRVWRAMLKHPFMVGGSRRFDTIAMKTAAKTLSGGRFVTKSGAEGVHAAILPELGLGVAVKAEDGAKRASDVAMAGILRALGAIEDEAAALLDGTLRPPIKNTLGDVVGHVEISVTL